MMPVIQEILYRRILNSHVEFTTEFKIRLDDGSEGVGSSPTGETISIYEDREISITPQMILDVLKRDGLLGKFFTQAEFDDYLEQRMAVFGRNNAFSLSLAFFNANSANGSIFDMFDKSLAKLRLPFLCLNVLNGGRHAYTNPVLSDFSEFMLVARSRHLEEVIAQHNDIQRAVRAKLARLPKTMISGNSVHYFLTADNRECIEFLLNILYELRLADRFDLMIDASASDLWTGSSYKFAITNGQSFTPGEFTEYWLDLIRQYNLRFLEDPFHEQDDKSWRRLTVAASECHIIGDNYYSSNAARIKAGAERKQTHGIVIKPNQSGTVTGVRSALEAAHGNGQVVITSHRSISTEETFLSALTIFYDVKYVKIGPLQTDFSAVIRLNEIIRLAETAA